MPPFTLTIFPDLSGHQATEHVTDLPGLIDWLRNIQTYPDKRSCPLISMARYGDRRTAKNSLRHDANILATTGLTGDYDKGAVSPADAAALLDLAGVAAVIVTTPSHGTAGSRWRVIVPFAQERTVAERHALMGKLNALLGGVLAIESFTASQSFYIGRVVGVAYEVHTSTGEPIDTAPGIDTVEPVGPPAAQPRSTDVDEFAQLAKVARGGIEQIRAALAVIPNTEPDWERWNRIGMAVYAASAGDPDGLEAWRDWSDRCPVAGRSEDSVDARWEHYRGSPPTAIGMGSLVHLASVGQSFQLAPAPPPPPDALPVGNAGVTINFPAKLETMTTLGARGARLVRYNEGWWTYEGGRYRMSTDEILRAEIRGACDWPVKPGAINDTMDELKSACVVDSYGQDLPLWLDGTAVDPGDFIVCANGILDPRTRTLHPHTDTLFTFNAVPYAYEPDAAEPARWLTFLNETFSGDAETLHELQKMFGYLLTLDTRQQAIFLLIGPKRSGKGTLARILSALLGEGNVCNPSFSSLSGEFGMEHFVGKQLAIFPDARVGSETKRATVAERLLSVSGEDSISINRKKKTFWEGVLPTRILILANEAPIFSDDSGALVARYRVFHTPNSAYGREDHTLTASLLTELPGILNWALDGLTMLRAEGRINTPRASRELLDEIDHLGSPIKGFVAARCILAAGQTVPYTALWDEYRRWHGACGVHGRPLSMDIFARALRTAYPGRVQLLGDDWDGVGLPTVKHAFT